MLKTLAYFPAESDSVKLHLFALQRISGISGVCCTRFSLYLHISTQSANSFLGYVDIQNKNPLSSKSKDVCPEYQIILCPAAVTSAVKNGVLRM